MKEHSDVIKEKLERAVEHPKGWIHASETGTKIGAVEADGLEIDAGTCVPRQLNSVAAETGIAAIEMAFENENREGLRWIRHPSVVPQRRDFVNHLCRSPPEFRRNSGHFQKCCRSPALIVAPRKHLSPKPIVSLHFHAKAFYLEC